MDEEELVQLIASALLGRTPSDMAKSKLAVWLYQPQPALAAMVTAFLTERAKPKRSAKQRQAGGYMLERIATALFAGINGASTIASYRSYTAQLDILFRSAGTMGGAWANTLFKVPFNVLLEAKATAGKVDDATMARLCNMLTGQFETTASIGIFLAMEGITGAKDKQKPFAANLHRLLHYAQSRKPIIVVDAEDLAQLGQGENFVTMIQRKIEELDNGPQLVAKVTASCDWCVLPEHMSETLAACVGHEVSPDAEP